MQKVSEYYLEIPQSHTADQPTVSQGRATEHLKTSSFITFFIGMLRQDAIRFYKELFAFKLAKYNIYYAQLI